MKESKPNFGFYANISSYVHATLETKFETFFIRHKPIFFTRKFFNFEVEFEKSLCNSLSHFHTAVQLGSSRICLHYQLSTELVGSKAGQTLDFITDP